MNTKLQIIRKPEVLNQSGFSRSTLHTRVIQQLFTPPIPLGERAVGWVQSEVNAILNAMISGSSKEEIRQLVLDLISARKKYNPEVEL